MCRMTETHVTFVSFLFRTESSIAERLVTDLSSSMPPLIFIIILLSLCSGSESTHNCFSVPNSSRSSCPPFTTFTPPFPFSASAGCGHPSFRIHCAHPHSTITINDQRFSLIGYEHNSTSLRISVISSNTSSALPPHCSARFTTLLHHPVNLSDSPFRISESSCSRLQRLRPCSPRYLHNCSQCQYECQIIQNPVRLLHGCGSAVKRAVPEQDCQTDVLEYLDGFFNRFGIEIKWDESHDAYFSSCRECEVNNGVCGFDSSDPGKRFMCFKRESTISAPWIRRHSPNLLTKLLSVFVILSLLILIGVAAVKYRSFGKKSVEDLSEDPTTLFLHRQRSASLLPPVFTYDELESATGKFDSNRKIGDGGFGSVYLAHLNDGRVVAVKHLHNRYTSSANGGGCSTKSFCNEILILSSIHHPNLIKLHGYCSDPRGLLLVFDFFPNGTLADHLHKQRSSNVSETLTWQVRVEIAIQVAAAIEYLHFSVKPPVVHRDITSSNIFMDREMRVKVGDFGLSRLMVGPELNGSGTDEVTTGPQGTPGYLDPDYHRCFRLTEKSDVYSFGVVLMELITGMKAVDGRRESQETALADLVVVRILTGRLKEVVDVGLVLDMDVVTAAAELAFRCVAVDKDDRPDMTEVVAELRRISGVTTLSRSSCSNLVAV